MNISCDCSVEVDDRSDFYQETFPVARKIHKCCECGGNILPKQKYSLVVGKWEGNFKKYRTCMPCYCIRDHYCHFGFYFGRLRETIKECLEFDYTEIPEEDEDE